MIRRVGAGLALAGLAGASACTGTVGTDAPLSLGGDGQITVCFPGETSPRHTHGLVPVRHTGGPEVLITNVSLVDPQEMRLIEAVLVPVYVHSGGTNIIGGRIGYPPASGGEYAGEHPRWCDRVPAVGARVAPGPDGTVVNGVEEKDWTLTLGIEAQGPASHSKQTLVAYQDSSGRRYEVRDNVELLIRQSCIDEE